MFVCIYIPLGSSSKISPVSNKSSHFTLLGISHCACIARMLMCDVCVLVHECVRVRACGVCVCVCVCACICVCVCVCCRQDIVLYVLSAEIVTLLNQLCIQAVYGELLLQGCSC